MKIISMIFILLLSGCGSGFGDGSTDIGYGYVFEMSGGDATYITYEGVDRNAEIVISSRVEQFYLYGDWIFASRMKRKIYKENNVTKSMIINKCEYWTINVKNHAVKGPVDAKNLGKITEWIGLQGSFAAQELKNRRLRCPLVVAE